jgi:SAM-dependent methyltransferase
MKTKLQRCKTWLAQFALIRQTYFSLIWIYKFPGFIRDYLVFKRLSKKQGRFSIKFTDLFPQLFDNTGKTHFDPHYTYHPAWAARIVAAIKPTKHIDISSILHFSTLVSAFVPVEFYDYRPAEVRLDNLACKKGDLTALPFPDNSVESISCMHTIEHVGLGRYGDPIDPDGDIKAITELIRVVKPGGTLIFVTPVGKPKIMYNAHRIYSYEQVTNLFPGMALKEFSLVPDDFKTHGLITHADKDMVKSQSYACGCFWFVKK